MVPHLTRSGAVICVSGAWQVCLLNAFLSTKSGVPRKAHEKMPGADYVHAPLRLVGFSLVTTI